MPLGLLAGTAQGNWRAFLSVGEASLTEAPQLPLAGVGDNETPWPRPLAVAGSPLQIG